MNDALDALSDAELNALYAHEILFHFDTPVSNYIEYEQRTVLDNLQRSGIAWGRERDGGVFMEHDGGQVWAFHKTNFIRAVMIATIRYSRMTKRQ